MELLLVSDSVNDLDAISEKVLDFAGEEKIFSFKGNLGAGKTTLIKSLVKRLGSDDVVTSPTFSIVNEYRTRKGTAYHFDFYRIKDETEAYDLGYEEYFFSNNYCFIEWPEKVGNLLPEQRVKVEFLLFGDQRKIILNR